MQQLPALNKITFERKVLYAQTINIQLHGFCDAIEKAYGACIYLRSINVNGEVQVNLLCAKSRVAPLKTIQTIPKLELCAALLLANLYNTVKSSIDTPIDQAIFWTDSMIVFHWINKSPDLLKTFVANRVSEIQSKTNASDWRHIRTHDNPADLLSRGIFPENLDSTTIWKKGPPWLTDNEKKWPKKPTLSNAELPELKRTTCLLTTTFDDSILYRYSSFNKLQRIIAFCLRMKRTNTNKGFITNKEIAYESNTIIKLVQQQTFTIEISRLTKGLSLPNKSKLLCLQPFLDNNGILRVGGRLQNSNLIYNHRHPILLPENHRITKLLIEREHLKNLHSGIRLTLYNLRLKFWPIDGKSQVQKIVRKCLRCTRINPLPVDYIMGNLPKVRTTMTRPFTNTGVDYCGPFFIKERKFRNKIKIKIYIAIFISLNQSGAHRSGK